MSETTTTHNPDNDAADRIVEEHMDLLVSAPMLVMFRRYIGRTEDEPATWRMLAVTKIADHTYRSTGRLMDARIAQSSEGIIGFVANDAHLMRGSRCLMIGWSQLSETLKQRIVDSSILPIEYKSVENLDRQTADMPEGEDVLYVMASSHVMELLS